MFSFLSLAELAALGTAVGWTFTAIFFTEAGKRIGAMRTNLVRILFAAGCYLILRLIRDGSLIPQSSPDQFWWLTLSGFIGLVLGDSAGFASYLKLGPRVGTLILATHPILATALGYVFLGEKIGWLGLLGIALTMSGVFWVTGSRKHSAIEDQEETIAEHRKRIRKGALLAIIGASGQATGFVITKHALIIDGGMTPFDAAMIRMLTAAVLLWVIALVRGQFGFAVRAFADRPALLYAFGGAFCGPFLGVWLSFIAVASLSAGVASTLSATTPLLVLPVVAIFYKEKITLSALFAALLTVGGVALLILYK